MQQSSCQCLLSTVLTAAGHCTSRGGFCVCLRSVAAALAGDYRAQSTSSVQILDLIPLLNLRDLQYLDILASLFPEYLLRDTV